MVSKSFVLFSLSYKLFVSNPSTKCTGLVFYIYIRPTCFLTRIIDALELMLGNFGNQPSLWPKPPVSALSLVGVHFSNWAVGTIWERTFKIGVKMEITSL